MSHIFRIPSLLPVIVIVTVLLGGEASATEKWGPFRGQVVDLETGQPIPGAVVLVVWWELYGFPFTGERFYEVREAVTGADGRFEIPRLSGPGPLSVQPPWFHLFAPGYVPHADIVNPPKGEPFVDPTVTQMRRLKTKEELLKKSRGYPSGIPEEKMREFLKAINVERAMLGLSPEGKR